MTTPEPLFTSHEIVRRSGASYRQVHYWTTVGLLQPILPPRGTGHWAKYRPIEAQVAAALAYTTALLTYDGVRGLPSPLARSIAHAARRGQNQVTIVWPTIDTEQEKT